VDPAVTPEQVSSLRRDSSWQGLHVTVAGVGVAGFAAADARLTMGADVTVVDTASGEGQQERATVLRTLGATVHLGVGELPDAVDLLVVSPGLPPAAPIIRSAADVAVPVWGELELAWRLRGQDASEWLLITGTNGKTTTTLMLASMLAAADVPTDAVGNIGRSLVDAVMHGPHGGALAVEVGAPQLPFVASLSPLAAACLNFAPDHVDHFGGLDAYRAAKSKVYDGTRVAAVYNVADRETERMVEDADVVEGCRAIGFTLGVPAPSMVGVVDGLLVDRAFLAGRRDSAQELASVDDVEPYAPHNVENALAAAALARAYGVPAGAVREGLRRFQPAGHRIADAGEVAGVRYVDDSKATNAHAAQGSLRAYEHVVWIAGGLAKGQAFDDLVLAVRDRLRGVVLLGADRAVFADALARHAPEVPVIEVARTDTGAMEDVVVAAAGLASPGDTVLLAPACASWDMFTDYAHRGREFVAAVQRLREVPA
jgi:UDP-N-acetylmuramoylalanine--D-glutamate ligase